VGVFAERGGGADATAATCAAAVATFVVAGLKWKPLPGGVGGGGVLAVAVARRYKVPMPL